MYFVILCTYGVSRINQSLGLFCRISSLFCRALLQKRPIIESILITEASPYYIYTYIWTALHEDDVAFTHTILMYSHVWHSHSHVWHDWYSCETWRILMCDVTQSHVWHDSFQTCDMTHSHVWRCTFTRLARCVRTPDMTPSYWWFIFTNSYFFEYLYILFEKTCS